MSFAPPDRMQPAEIISEIGALSRELQAQLTRIQSLSEGLYTRVRRSPADDNTALYMRYASGWTRFANMVSQGVRRASAGDRALRRLKPTAIESVVKPPIRQEPVAATPVESLLDMYGEEFAPDASDAAATEAE